MHAIQENPGSVSAEWQEFFRALEDSPADISKAAKGASWQKKNWPVPLNGELVSALDGDWPAVEKAVAKKIEAKAVEIAGQPASPEEIQRAARDSVRAIMMIRAYRMRGHLHAKLDPLELAAPVDDYHELSPSNYGFTEADYGSQDLHRQRAWPANTRPSAR
jgi:2-oxoglutarate dehydrogenase E1 component